MPKRRKIDWEAIEREYRLGQKTLRALQVEFGVHNSSISRRAKRDGWVQDKTEEIKQRTNAALVAQQERSNPTKKDIDTAVKTNLAIIRGHGKTIGKLNKEIKDILCKLKKLNEKDPVKDIRFRINSVKEISFALKNLIPLERQALNIDGDRGGTTDSISELLSNIAGATRGLPGKS